VKRSARRRAHPGRCGDGKPRERRGGALRGKDRPPGRVVTAGDRCPGAGATRIAWRGIGRSGSLGARPPLRGAPWEDEETLVATVGTGGSRDPPPRSGGWLGDRARGAIEPIRPPSDRRRPLISASSRGPEQGTPYWGQRPAGFRSKGRPSGGRSAMGDRRRADRSGRRRPGGACQGRRGSPRAVRGSILYAGTMWVP
jgi:hypothetical protein